MRVTEEILAERVAHARNGMFYGRYLDGKKCDTRAEFQSLPVSSLQDLGPGGLAELHCPEPGAADVGSATTFLEDFLTIEGVGPLLAALDSEQGKHAGEVSVVARGPGPDGEIVSWSAETVDQALVELASCQPELLVGEARLLLLLAEQAISGGVSLPTSLATVLATGLLTPAARARLQEVWGARVVEFYQRPEALALGVSCNEGSLHLANDLYSCEILDPVNGEPVPPGECGVLVVTSLQPTSLPLVRWSTGDLVEMASAACKCERADFPVRRLGRVADQVELGGRKAAAGKILDAAQAFAEAMGSRKFHVAVRADTLRLLVEVSDPRAALPTREHLDLRKQVGLPMDIRLVPRDSIRSQGAIAEVADGPACQLWDVARWSEQAAASRTSARPTWGRLSSARGRTDFREARKRDAALRSLWRAVESDDPR